MILRLYRKILKIMKKIIDENVEIMINYDII